MKITDYSRSTIGVILGTAGNANAITGVKPTGAAASNYILIATSSNTAVWEPQSTSTIAAGTYFLAKSGGQGVLGTLGSLGSTETVALVNGLYQTGTLNAACTISFSGWTAGTYCEVSLRLTEDGTGGWTPTFSGVTWIGGTTPTHTTTAGTSTDYTFWSTDGGANILGGQVGAGTSFAFAHPSTSSNSFSSNVVITNDASMAITMPQFGTLHMSAPFYSEVVTSAADFVWYGDDLVHDLVRLY